MDFLCLYVLDYPVINKGAVSNVSIDPFLC
jgi:hypothetical protein